MRTITCEGISASSPGATLAMEVSSLGRRRPPLARPSKFEHRLRRSYVAKVARVSNQCHRAQGGCRLSTHDVKLSHAVVQASPPSLRESRVGADRNVQHLRCGRPLVESDSAARVGFGDAISVASSTRAKAASGDLDLRRR